MINEIYELYKSTLPNIVRSEETVKNILSDEENHIIDYKIDDKLVGVSVINENCIYLLTVAMPYQNQGLGTELLNQSEKHIISRGFNKVVLGAGKEYIMPGIPMNNGAQMFFEKRGYIHSWGECGCFDMDQLLENFKYNDHSMGDTINGVVYRRAESHDIDNVVQCVSDAEEDFTRYYQDKGLYGNDAGRLVLIAEKDNEVLGALIVCIENEGENIGSVGCVATAPKYRNRGVATTMVTLGTKYLKELGLRKAFIGYTYTDILNMYGKSGYKVSEEYFMGEKSCE